MVVEGLAVSVCWHHLRVHLMMLWARRLGLRVMLELLLRRRRLLLMLELLLMLLQVRRWWVVLWRKVLHVLVLVLRVLLLLQVVLLLMVLGRRRLLLLKLLVGMVLSRVLWVWHWLQVLLLVLGVVLLLLLVGAWHEPLLWVHGTDGLLWRVRRLVRKLRQRHRRLVRNRNRRRRRVLRRVLLSVYHRRLLRRTRSHPAVRSGRIVHRHVAGRLSHRLKHRRPSRRVLAHFKHRRWWRGRRRGRRRFLRGKYVSKSQRSRRMRNVE